MKVVYLIADKRDRLWETQDFSKIFRESINFRNAIEHFKYIKSHHGEKIAITKNDEITGWIGLIPDTDSKGKYYTLSGHEVSSDYRRQGIGLKLLEESRSYILNHHASRLKFGTSPLLTINSFLHITKMGTRYTWNNKIKLTEGVPWPYAACECDFNNPMQKPAELEHLDILSINFLDWDDYRPVPREPPGYYRQISVLLPPITKQRLNTSMERIHGFLKILFNFFDSLNRKGYGFAWFDKISLKKKTFYYYYMTKEINTFAF